MNRIKNMKLIKTINMEQKVEIGVNELVDLLTRNSLLGCLENAGVDNWEGYEIINDEDIVGKDGVPQEYTVEDVLINFKKI